MATHEYGSARHKMKLCPQAIFMMNGGINALMERERPLTLTKKWQQCSATLAIYTVIKSLHSGTEIVR